MAVDGIGRRVAKARRNAGYKTPEALASAIDDAEVTKSVIVNIEQGRKKDVGIRQLMLIAKTLGVPATSLIADTDQPFGGCDIPGFESYSNSDVLDLFSVTSQRFGVPVPNEDSTVDIVRLHVIDKVFPLVFLGDDNNPLEALSKIARGVHDFIFAYDKIEEFSSMSGAKYKALVLLLQSEANTAKELVSNGLRDIERLGVELPDDIREVAYDVSQRQISADVGTNRSI